MSECKIQSAIGIDLGTTNSCVAIVVNGVAEVIPNEYKERTTPSVVSIFQTGTRYIGKQAKDAQYKNLQNTIYESKRLIGRKFDEECVQDRMFHWPFKVIQENGNPKIAIKLKAAEKSYYPEEISGMVLEKMKTIAEEFVGFPITKAVVTVPAYFNDNQRQATIDAAKIAGLDVLKIINEPTAATFTYILKNNIRHVCNTLVFDLGGGTLDVSIIKSNGDDFTVLAVNGDQDLGGADFDILIYNEIVNVLTKKTNYYGTLKEDQIRRLMANCIKVKEQLSQTLKARFDLPEILPNYDFEHEFTRVEFEKLASNLVRRIMAIVKSSLREAQMSPSDIDNIVIVGGCSKIPAVKQGLEDLFKKDLSFAVNPDEAVACGAAYQAAILNGETTNLRNISVVDVTPFSLGLETGSVNMDVVIKKNSPLPAKYSKIYTTMLENQTALRIIIYQGEDKLTANNTKLGYFDLIGIPRLPAGIPKILVTFDINTNGVIQVTATETSSKETNRMEIVTNMGRIPDEDIIRIKKENRESVRKQKLQEMSAKEKNDVLKLCYEYKRIVTNSKTIANFAKINFIRDLDKAIKLIEGLSINNIISEDLEKEKANLKDKYFKLITRS